jgi:hypothetical protein
MDALVQSIGKILYHDLFYIVSGLVIMSAALELVDAPMHPWWNNEVVSAFLLIAAAYAIGMLNQEFWSQFPFLKTRRQANYHRFLLGIYRRHMGEEWQKRDIDKKSIVEDPNYQRAINLKQLGSSLGSALLTTCFILEIAAIFERSPKLAITGAVCLIFAALFILMSWLHNMRQSAFKERL